MSPKRTLESIARVIGAVQLEGVRLAESSCSTAIRSPQEVKEARVAFTRHAKLAQRDEGGVFYVLAAGEATVSSEPESKPVVSIRATFELQYRLPKDLEVSDADLNMFADLNGVFNAWPYWREFVQATSCRMNLPPIVLPVFRLPKPKSAKKEVVGKEQAEARTH